MDSPSSSPFSFVDADGRALSAPREWTPALVLLPLDPGDLPRTRLLLQGTLVSLAVRIVDGEMRVVGEWPRAGTGNYRLRLEMDADDDAAPAEVRGEEIVSVRPHKISEAAYVALINDLQGDALPTSVALALERTGGLAGVHLKSSTETTLEQELLRLRRAIAGPASRPGLATLLSEIARDAYRILRRTEEWVRAERARRVEAIGLVRALQRPGNVDVETRRPHYAPDVRVEHTYDVYENRLLRLFVDQVDRRLRRLAAALLENRMYAAVAEVEALQRRLAVSRHEARFLEGVALPGYLSTRTTMVLLRRPLYRAAFERFLEFQRDAYVMLDDDALDAPLDNLPHLYETWSVLQVIKAVIEIAEEAQFVTQSQRIARHVGQSVFVRVVPDGKVALVMTHPDDGREIRVIPQRSFSRNSKRYRSMSLSQRPDITVEVSSPAGRPTLLLFDPKYKLHSENVAAPVDDDDDSLEGAPGQPKKVDIDKMHAYRDAIRDEERRTVVRHAAILYPGPTVVFEEAVSALSARPDAAAQLHNDLRRILEAAILTTNEDERSAAAATGVA
jgi:predicted component of viral defense system (DUF524 family)